MGAGAGILERLRETLGSDVAIDPSTLDLTRHLKDYGTTDDQPDACILAVVLARTTDQVSAALKLCSEASVAVVPQGGMSGLAGGGAPIGPCVVLSVERMRAIETLDEAGQTITVEGGVVLETIQKAAAERGFFFPLDVGARGSAQAAGLAATNAGGNRVLRYGMMRDLILGLEVVLMDGTVITALNTMIKNNAGYDLKQLFIGSEGTLGVITRLVLRLHPAPAATCTGLAACADYAAVLDLLDQCRRGFGSGLSAFECMWADFYSLGCEPCGRTPPLAHGHGFYVLIETQGADPGGEVARFEAVIGAALEAGVVQDAVVASSQRETAALWAIRDTPGDYSRVFDPAVHFDVSLPVGRIGVFAEECRRRLEARWPGVAAVFFGHVADSNLHIGVRLEAGRIVTRDVKDLVYGCIGDLGGSISAEHGIGIDKRDYLHHSRSPQEIALMRRLKAALDPAELLNPGKVL
jgi:FAD/FMN-containing dehydrogenase